MKNRTTVLLPVVQVRTGKKAIWLHTWNKSIPNSPLSIWGNQRF